MTDRTQVFENDRVAERQRGCHGPNAENDGDIERGDHPDDAGGYPPGHGQPWLLTREKLTVRPARQAGGFVALLFRDMHCEGGHGRDSTDLTDVPPGDLISVFGPEPASRSTAARWGWGVAAQPSWASAAISAALATSSALATPTSPRVEPVAGSMTGAVPPDGGTHAPPTKTLLFQIVGSRSTLSALDRSIIPPTVKRAKGIGNSVFRLLKRSGRKWNAYASRAGSR